jgi:hypothetical protein
MTERWERMLGELRQIEAPEWPVRRGLPTMPGLGLRHRVHRPAIAAVLGAIVGVAVWLIGANSPDPQEMAERITIVDTGELIRGGRQVTLNEAEEAYDYPVYRTDAPALTGSLEEIWIGEPGDPVTSLEYGKGVQLHMSKWGDGDPSAFYKSRIDMWGFGWIQEINGGSALVIPRDAQEPGVPAETRVVMVMDGVEVIFVSAHLSPDDLVAVAESVKPNRI